MLKRRNTFIEVLNNGDDQDIVQQLLEETIPKEIKEEIVEKFNNHIDQLNRIQEELDRDLFNNGWW